MSPRHKNLTPYYRSRTDELVEACSEANRPFVAHHVAQRRNEQQKPRSVYAWTLAASRLDQHVSGQPFLSLPATAYTSLLSAYREQLAPRSLLGLATHVKTLYRDAHNTDHLPRDVRKALMVKVPRDAPAGRLVSDPEWRSLLDAASCMTGGSNGVPTATLWTALLWTLYDAGLRAEEALFLQVGDVELLGDGTALLHLRPDGRPLKTGPRIVPVAQAVPALQALLSLHPHQDGALSPLFLNRRNRGGFGQMRYLSLNRGLTKLAEQSGVNQARPLDENVTPHDFRHTCATRKARNGWNEGELRKFFGWLNSSRMAAYYVHLNYADIANRTARDAGLVRGMPEPVTPPDLASLVARLVAAELAKR